MTADTIAINQMMDQFDGHHSVWLFGYGSLIYKADFPYLQRRPASITNWTRRFWQGSHDHRGTPEAPGRVVTIIEQAGAICHGMAYLVTPEVFAHLDHREKNGYLRLATTISFDDGDSGSNSGSNSGSDSGSDSDSDSVVGLVYIATPDNTAFLGEASEQEIARHIARSIGPSGPNSDYLNHLAHALRELGRHDQHVFEIERHLAALNAPPPTVPSE
ncbi:gamma-glutamylcyclotransferase [Oxalobacteraceae bacterium OTU3CINTB1]|nr:gamma-glutamylcyclotransferase [Oxalobacteraceae bacterium OTU3CINTB1]